MNTSIYFLLWLGVYFVLDLIGIGGDNSFFVALILVFATAALLRKVFANQFAYIAQHKFIDILEIYYTGNVSAMQSRLKKDLIFSICSSAYLAIGAVVLFLIKGEIGTIFIFALFAFFSIKGTMAKYKEYKEVQYQGLPPQSEEFNEQLAIYAERRRMGYSPMQIAPQPTSADKAFKWANIACSVICIMIGLFFAGISLLAIIAEPAYAAANTINLSWGSLAIIFGINDLIGTSRIA